MASRCVVVMRGGKNPCVVLLISTFADAAGEFVPNPTALSSLTAIAAVDVVPPELVTIRLYVELVAPPPNTCSAAADGSEEPAAGPTCNAVVLIAVLPALAR